MLKTKFDKNEINQIENIIGYKFSEKNLIFNAFCHSSYANSFSLKSNERLEFLGDSVLGFVIADKIYHDKDYAEGNLSKLRSKIVSENPLADLCDKLDLAKFMLIGNGSNKFKPTVSMKADLIESIIAAIYLDGGLKFAKKFILSHFKSIINNAEGLEILEDSKSLLQEKFYDQKIKYVYSKTGKEHDPIFKVKVYINDCVCGKGEASTKKQAEQIAAKEALKNITKV